MITKTGVRLMGSPTKATCQGEGCPFKIFCRRASATSENKCLGMRRPADNLWECEFYHEKVTVSVSRTIEKEKNAVHSTNK